MGSLAGEGENGRQRLAVDGHLRLEFREAKVITDGGLLAVRELLRQSAYARLAGYEDVNDQERHIGIPPCGRLLA